MNLEKITRLEIIDSVRGRVLVLHNYDVTYSIQDDDRTLKLFINETKTSRVE